MFWLCFKTPEGICVVLQPGSSLVHARMQASLAGLQPGELKEAHQLDAKLTKRIPKDMIGKCLSQAQAARLLSSIERSRKRA